MLPVEGPRQNESKRSAFWLEMLLPHSINAKKSG